MEQNNIWMRYLLIGFLSIILLSSSCKKLRERTQNAEFSFINKSNQKISFSHPLFSFNIDSKSTFSYSQIQNTGNKTVTESNYINPIDAKIGSKESIVIKFNGNMCLIMTRTSENSLLDNNNYIAEKVNSRTYKFTYTFTEADYNRATICP